MQTTQNGSINKVVSKININTGKSQIVSDIEGNNTASFSPNFNYFINTTSSAKTPHKYVLRDRNGKSLKEIQNNDELLTKLKTDNWVEKEFLLYPMMQETK